MVQISNNDHHALFGELSLNRRMYMMNDQMVYERDFVNNNRTVDRRLKWQRMNETVVCNVDSNIELTVRSVLETHIANGVAQNQVHYLQSFPNGNHPIHMWEYFVPNGPTFEITARQSMSRLEINQITILLQDRTIVLTDIDWTFNRVMPLDFFTPPAEC